MRWLATLIFLGLCPAGLAAKPLVSSHDEPFGRICLEARGSLERVISACQTALDAGGLTQTQRVEYLIELGIAQHMSDRPDVATDTFRRALNTAPNNVAAWNGLGWALRSSGQPQDASSAFQQSLDREATSSALTGKATVNRALRLISGDEARELLGAALELDPSNDFAQREIGWSYFDEGDYEAATRAFEERLALDATDLNAIYGAGRAALNDGDAEQALLRFNRVIEDRAGDTASRVGRIVALRKLGRSTQALKEADRLVADRTDLIDGYLQRGLTLSELQRMDEAIDAFRQADEAFGPDGALLYWYADTLADDGQMDEAFQVIDRASQLTSANESDHLLKSWIALELRRYDEAEDAAEDALEFGDDAWAHFYIAIARVHSDDAPGGVKRFERALEAGLPEDLVGTFAQELMNAGNYVEAVQLRLKY